MTKTGLSKKISFLKNGFKDKVASLFKTNKPKKRIWEKKEAKQTYLKAL